MDRLIRSMDRILEARVPTQTPAGASPNAPAAAALGASRTRAGRRFASRLLWLTVPVALATLAAVWFGLVPQFYATRTASELAPVPATPVPTQPTEAVATPPPGERPRPIPPALPPERPETTVAENQSPPPVGSGAPAGGPAPSPPAAAPATPPVVSAPAAPPTPPRATYRVLASVSEGKLNMRGGPGTKHPLVVSIPAGATGLGIGHCRMPDDGGAKPWCEATWRSFSGWVSSCCVVDEKTGAFPR